MARKKEVRRLLKTKMCAGCQKKLYEGTQYFRGKTYCGSYACEKVIDNRKRILNRKKKDKRRERGKLYRGVNTRTRSKVLKRDGKKCAMCGSDDLVQVHHIIPAASGGSDDYRNLITLCYKDHETVHKNMKQYSNLLAELANRREDGI